MIHLEDGYRLRATAIGRSIVNRETLLGFDIENWAV
jgi:hypothetical protein